MLSGRTGRDCYGLALGTASISWTEAEGPSRLSRRRTACRMTPIQAILEDGRGISGWLRITASADFIRRRETFRNYSESDGLPGNILSPYEAEGSWQSPRRRDGLWVNERRDNVLPRSAFPESLCSAGCIDRISFVQQARAAGPGLSAPTSPSGRRILSRSRTRRASSRWNSLA